MTFDEFWDESQRITKEILSKADFIPSDDAEGHRKIQVYYDYMMFKFMLENKE